MSGIAVARHAPVWHDVAVTAWALWLARGCHYHGETGLTATLLRFLQTAPPMSQCLLLYKQRGEVDYSLRAIPLGGYVAFPDDDPKNNTYKPDDPDLLQNRSVPERMLVISAGVIANIVFALAILFAQVSGSCCGDDQSGQLLRRCGPFALQL